ncbi:MAG: sensor histidine kinase [Planctomycetota bacterium]|jgi:signal transduction histidine kinase
MYSLKSRITRNLTINMVVVMSALLIIMYFFMQQLLQDYVLTRLQHDAESLISALEKTPDQRWHVNPGRMSSLYDRVKSGHYYQVQIDSRVILSRSLFDADFPEPVSDPDFMGHYLASGPVNETWLLWVQQVHKDDQAIRIQIAEDIEPIRQQLLENTILALVLVLMVTAILIYLQQRTISRSFQIFEWLRQNLSSIRHRETQKSGLQMPNEIAPLVSEIEKLVDHLSQRIDRTRHAIGNLAHELKRPVQLLELQQEKGQHAPLQDIKKIIERELKRAKISGSLNAQGDFNLAEEMPFLISVLEKIYPHVQIDLVIDNKAVTRELDRDDMLELAGNLMDNACKFAQGRVQLKVAGNERKLTLIIEDDGEGLDMLQVEDIQQRGIRLDETVEGHGLGLGICKDILDSYGGEITFSKSDLGGLYVCVDIPYK